MPFGSQAGRFIAAVLVCGTAPQLWGELADPQAAGAGVGVSDAIPAPSSVESGPATVDFFLGAPDKNASPSTGVGDGYAWNRVDVFGTYAGFVAPQGDPILGTDMIRSNLGLTGAGIKVGIISDSFNSGGGASSGVASGDLPGPGNPLNGTPTQVLRDSFGSDEGRALAEIVHDIAPGAELLFHSAFNNSGGGTPSGTIATAINNLVNAGADIIVDDVFILTTPFFQDGAAARAADAAVAAGVGYYSSAGNNGNTAHQGTYNGTTGGFFNFSGTGTDERLDFSLADGATTRITLQWSDPYPSVSGAFDADEASDFNLLILDGNQNLLADSSSVQTGTQDPVEFISLTNTSGSDQHYQIAINAFSGPVSGETIKVLIEGAGEVFDDDFTFSPTVFGQAGSEGAVAVGAQVFDPFNISVGGSGPNEVNDFSSLGPVTILFDDDGDPVFVTRPGAELVGPDGVNTTFFGEDIDDVLSPLESDAFPNFFGTSAAAPHVAAVAALLMEQANLQGLSLTFEEINQILFDTAVDLESPGFDNLAGWGRVDVVAASAAIAAIPEPATFGLLVTGLGALTRRRRRPD